MQLTDFPSLDLRFPAAAMTPAGELAIHPRREAAERLSIGCETLDRDYWEFDRGFEGLKELSPGWSRIQAGWDKCEKEKNVYDFAWLDHIVDSLCSLNIRPWLCVCFGCRAWYGEETPIRSCPLRLSPEITAAWERFLTALADRYKGRVDHFEIWNEPDLCWRGGDDQRSFKLYTDFVKVSSTALRKGNPESFILGGSVACGIRNSLRYNGIAIADQFFSLGAKGYVDGYSYHAYDVFPEMVQEPEVRAFRRMLKRHGLEKLPLWQGEGGCPAVWQKDNALSKHPWNEAKQARHLLRNMLCDLRHGAEISSWFMITDFTYKYADGTLGPCHYGLLAHPDYSKRPSFYAYQTLCELFRGRVEWNDDILFSLHKTDHERQEITIEESAGVDALRVGIQRFTFSNKGFPLLAWYRCVNPHIPEELFLNTLVIEGEKAELFMDPLLIDPITQTLWRPEKVTLEERWGGTRVRIDDLPVNEYPLFLVPEGFLELLKK